MSHTLDVGDILKRAHAVGVYYGFSPLSSVAARARGTVREKTPEVPGLDMLDATARDVVTFLKRAHGAGVTPALGRPLFLWHTNAAPGRPAPKQVIVQFHALGADRAIADAVLMRAVRSFVADISKEEPVLRINSMGDKETRARLSRELGSFFRRRGSTLPADCTECAKTDVFKAAEMLAKTDIDEHLPASTDHLSEASRKHFECVLEYLESTDTPYELAPRLLSRGGTWNETCFEVTGGPNVSAWGSRYHDLAKHFWKSSSASIGAVVRINLEKRDVVPAHKEAGKPRFVFVHIGDEAKRESMKMADILRKARIPLTQVLGVESLTEQMHHAERVNAPYLLIMGRKEALERSIIIRERSTHTEHSIPFDSLIERLRAVA